MTRDVPAWYARTVPHSRESPLSRHVFRYASWLRINVKQASVPSRPAPAIDLGALVELEPERVLFGRNRTKADVRFYRLGDRSLAVKTYAPRPAWIRHTVGRFLIRREARAYRAAADVEGLPTFYGRLGPYALATEAVPAEPLRSFRSQRLDDAVFDAAARTLESLHARGVAVVDLHHRDVLLSEDGAVYLVDLAMAWVADPSSRGWRKRVFRFLREQDHAALARMRARFTGLETVTAGAPRAARWHARGRRVKRLFDRLRGKQRNERRVVR